MAREAEAPRKRRVLNLHFRKAGAVEQEGSDVTLQAGVHERLHRVFSKYAQATTSGSSSGSVESDVSVDGLRFMARGQVAYLLGTNTPTSSGLRNGHIIRVSHVSPSAPSLAGTSEGKVASSRATPLGLGLGSGLPQAGAPEATAVTGAAAVPGSSRGPGDSRPAWEMSEAEWRAVGPDGLKDKGNACHKAQKYREAILWYSRGLVLAPEHHVLYSNRCAALYELHKRTTGGSASTSDEKEALVVRMLHDAEACTLINPRWDRGHYRLGLALEAKGSATEAQVSFANALKCNPSNADAKARLAASERSIGRVRDDNTKLPSIDNPVRPAFEKARSKAFRPFSAHTREALSWAEADLRREQGQRQEQEHREPGEVQRQGAEARMKGAQAQKQEVESQEGVAAVALDAPAAAAAGAASSKRAAAADQGKPSTAVMAPLPAAAWSSWADGKGADKAAQWFIDCFRLRETDDWLGPNAHFHNDDCRKVATLPLLIFCKLAVRKKVVPPRWNWGIFFSKCFDRSSKFSVLKKLSRADAEKQYSARVVGTSFNASQLSMVAVASYVLGCKAGDAWPSDSLVVRDDVSAGFYRWLQGRGAVAKRRGDGEDREGKSTAHGRGQGERVARKNADVFRDVGGETGWAEVYRKDAKDTKPCQCECCWEEDMLHLLDEFYGGVNSA